MPYKNKEKQKQAQKKHYLENKNKYLESRKNNRNKRNVWFSNFKSTLICESCNFDNVLCLDFHHKDLKNKEFGISEAVKLGYSEDRIINEIYKCEVLCANCHAKKHNSMKDIYHRKSVTQNLLWLNEYKSDIACLNCLEKDFRTLSFHHKENKNDCISTMVWRGCSITRLLEEISKCEILCHNCHRIRHNGNIWIHDSCQRNSCQRNYLQ